MKLHGTTRIHGRKHLYNASVYGDIYRYICGGLGVVISQRTCPKQFPKIIDSSELDMNGHESWTWDCWLSRSIKHGQNPSRSCRSSVSTRMLLLQRSNSQLLLSLDLESHRSGAFAAQIGAPTTTWRFLLRVFLRSFRFSVISVVSSVLFKVPASSFFKRC